MRHCSPEEMMDVAEGTRPADSLPHLTVCAACQAQVAELRLLWSEVAEATVPEPPPVFWEQWSARVRHAVAAEPPPVASVWMRVSEWAAWRPLWTSAAAVAAIGLVLLVLPRTGPGRPEGVSQAPAHGAMGSGVQDTAAAIPRSPAPERDESAELFAGFIGDLADGIDVDAAVSAGLTPERGAVEAAVSGLSGDEQEELRRLLQEALSIAGA